MMTTRRRPCTIRPRAHVYLAALTTLAVFASTGLRAGDTSACGPGDYTQEFRARDCHFVTAGRNTWFVLEPGYWLRLEGTEKDERVVVIITVLNDTETVDGVRTRVVEERESKNGELVEVSRNYFALCEQTGSVFYFGEAVDIYENGAVVSHGGAWRAGENGAKPGILMPGTFLLGSRYFQEVAPPVAMDQGCNTAVGVREITPAGTFTDCVAVMETSPLEPGKRSNKGYCAGIGLVRDNATRLVDWSERP